ncbi:MAG: recombinase family protein [Deltaproteobacteria bacterium]
MNRSKLQTTHLHRNAYVYIRQSTKHQVQYHLESQQRQYELRQLASELGYAGDKIILIDEDLGISASGRDERTGFERLVSDVALGRAGLVLGLEVSRLARNNRDWYELLDLCAIRDTLIGDADGIYDPAAYNDRLLLALKGTMSEAELHILKGRMLAGLKHKAKKGELRFRLPAGYEFDHDGSSAARRSSHSTARVSRRSLDAVGAALLSGSLLDAHQSHLRGHLCVRAIAAHYRGRRYGAPNDPPSRQGHGGVGRDPA